MLTDLALKRLKPKDKLYKLSDRDGMYVVVAPSGLITFRYDYRLNDRRETLTIGREVQVAGLFASWPYATMQKSSTARRRHLARQASSLAPIADLGAQHPLCRS